MKYFSIIKTGYTFGVYGNSGEYFSCILSDKRGMRSFKFNGQYGPEYRIAEALEKLGYKQQYAQSDYGKLTRKDIAKNNYSEHMALENIEELVEHCYIENN